MEPFTELDTWMRVRGLRNDILELTGKFPNEEKYRLSDQRSYIHHDLLEII